MTSICDVKSTTGPPTLVRAAPSLPHPAAVGQDRSGDRTCRRGPSLAGVAGRGDGRAGGGARGRRHREPARPRARPLRRDCCTTRWSGSGFSPELIEVAPSRELEDPCIVRGSVGDGPELVYFHGHFDVVPAQGPAQFEPQRRDGRIIGRGTADMKGGLVSMLYGAAGGARARVARRPPDRPSLRLRRGDRQRRRLGTPPRGRADRPGALAMLTAEPTGGVIWHACRGAITLRVQTAGREAHVGYVAPGRQRVRAHDPHRRAAHRARRTSCSSSARASRRERRGGRLDARRRRRRPAPAPGSTPCPARRGSPSTGASTPRRSSSEELARLTGMINEAAEAPAPRSRSTCCRASRPAARTQTHPAARTLARCIDAVEGAAPALPDVPRRARHALVLPARHPGLRLRRRPPRHLPRARRVHRRGRHAPLRRRLRALRRGAALRAPTPERPR